MTIELVNLCKSYGGHVVLDHVSASIEWGKCYGFVGEAGCGKSTLLKLFMGTEKPDEGEVRRMGDYKYPSLHSAYVSQEGLGNPKKNAIRNVRKRYRRIGKKGAVEELSKFMSTERMKLPLGELSAVEQRMVEIIGACVMPADFFVFDEPFAGMDREERNRAIAYIMEARGTRPLLIASRDEAALSDIPQIRMYHLS
ncbi:MAG: ATP-binding cassette domain-containing protein [Lachnospiraceae bacterium]|nr:ATP-binding cassette domain-containing protein [Lachnospiraceae bacterium]